MLTKKKINAAIAHTGLEVVGNTGAGYFYFLDSNKDQAGESVYVNALNHLPLELWVHQAEYACKDLNEQSMTTLTKKGNEMSAIRNKILNHPLLDEFENTDASVDEDYKYFIRLVDGYRISGYGGKTKHCRTLAECLHYLDTAEQGETY